MSDKDPDGAENKRETVMGAKTRTKLRYRQTRMQVYILIR